MDSAVERVIADHWAAGRSFVAGGVRSFVREEGQGDPIVLFHGLPCVIVSVPEGAPPAGGAGLSRPGAGSAGPGIR